MDFRIGDRKYKLDKVSITISEMYQDYIILLNEDATCEAEFEEARLDKAIAKEEAETVADRLRADRDFLRLSREIKGKMLKKTAVTARNLRREILGKIFKLSYKNEEFDSDLWCDNIGEVAFNELIGELLGGKKKDLEESST